MLALSPQRKLVSCVVPDSAVPHQAQEVPEGDVGGNVFPGTPGLLPAFPVAPLSSISSLPLSDRE